MLRSSTITLGNHQVEGVEYTDTFALVEMVIVRVLLAIIAAKN